MRIEKEFKELIPKLREEEYKQLEENILKEGIRDKLVTWQGILIDGHNRYSIAEKHGLEYDTIEKEFDSREQVINWILDNQLGRRNLTSQDRDYLLGLRYRQEKKKQGGTGANQYKEQSRQNVESANTSQKIGEQYNVSSRTVERAEKFADGVDNISKAKPEMKEEILSGKSDFTKQEVSSFANVKEEEVEKKLEEIKKPHVSNNSGNNEWYTPPHIIEFAKRVMGEIDTDPASNELANQTVKAKTFYTINNSGLENEWEGNVWMNPPYSSNLVSQFIDKFIEQEEKGNIEQAMILVNNATETNWFQRLSSKCDGILFLKGRLKYLNSEGVPANTPLQGQSILYYGKHFDKFSNYADGLVCRCCK